MSETYNADDVTNVPTGAVSGPKKPETYVADDVDNKPSGAVKSDTEPVVTETEFAPEAKVVEPPAKKTARKQTRASRKG